LRSVEGWARVETDATNWTGWARPDWYDQAACRGLPIELFVADVGHGRGQATAKQVCAICPAQDQCAALAIDTTWLTGLWGGTTTKERRTLRRQDHPGRAA